jgi:hypothetical protein
MTRITHLRRVLITALTLGRAADGTTAVSGPRRGAAGAGRARAPAVVLVLAASLAGLVGACGGGTGPQPDPVGSTSNQPPAIDTGSAQPSIPATPAPQQRPPVKPAPPANATPSAAEDLAPFFAAARSSDTRIRAAAAAINHAGVGRSAIHFDPSIRDVIKAAVPDQAAAAIPAGLNPGLLRAVLLVHSELVARSAAFNGVYEFTYEPVPVTDRRSVDMLNAFAAGSAIARRYPGDLAALRALAMASPRVRAARPDSRQAAELALHIALIKGANNGCGGNGGALYTALQPIVWKTIMTGYGRFDGTIAGIRFTVKYLPGVGWKAELNAC